MIELLKNFLFEDLGFKYIWSGFEISTDLFARGDYQILWSLILILILMTIILGFAKLRYERREKKYSNKQIAKKFDILNKQQKNIQKKLLDHLKNNI